MTEIRIARIPPEVLKKMNELRKAFPGIKTNASILKMVISEYLLQHEQVKDLHKQVHLLQEKLDSYEYGDSLIIALFREHETYLDRIRRVIKASRIKIIKSRTKKRRKR